MAVTWWDPRTWFAAEKAPELAAEAAAEISKIPAGLVPGYRSMARALEALADGVDAIKTAAGSGEPRDKLRAKNVVLYGGDLKRAVFGAPDGEDGPADSIMEASAAGLGFSDDQAADMSAVAKYCRAVAMEWDADARAGKLDKRQEP